MLQSAYIMDDTKKSLEQAKPQDEVLSFEDQSKLLELFNQSNVVGFVEMFTGIAGSNRADLLMSAGRFGQGMIKGEGLKQLFIEIQELRKKGKIDDQYVNSQYGKKNFADILKLIDEENVDPAKWEAIKKVFFCSIASDSEEKERAKAYYLTQMCLKLEAFDFEVLRVCNEICRTPNHAYQATNAAGEWINIVSEKLGYGLPEFVEKSESRLIEQGLISSRTYSDKSGIRPGANFRLSNLGIVLCKMISG
jgi:hypothetical protein